MFTTSTDTWLRGFAQELEGVEVILPESDTSVSISPEAIQTLRKIAKYVEELEQDRREYLRYTEEVKAFMDSVQSYLNLDTGAKALELCEEVLDVHKKSAERQDKLWTTFKEDIGQ